MFMFYVRKQRTLARTAYSADSVIFPLACENPLFLDFIFFLVVYHSQFACSGTHLFRESKLTDKNNTEGN